MQELQEEIRRFRKQRERFIAGCERQRHIDEIDKRIRTAVTMLRLKLDIHHGCLLLWDNEDGFDNIEYVNGCTISDDGVVSNDSFEHNIEDIVRVISLDRRIKMCENQISNLEELAANAERQFWDTLEPRREFDFAYNKDLITKNEMELSRLKGFVPHEVDGPFMRQFLDDRAYYARKEKERDAREKKA